jgi:hypothetical protein
MRHDASKKFNLNFVFTEDAATQRTEPAIPEQMDPSIRAESRPPAQAESRCGHDINVRDMKLPLELWREVIREAGSIQDEFVCPTFHSDIAGESPNRLYLVLWNKAFQTRLSLALVSRSWHSIALQYLYSSLVVRHDDLGILFAQMVAKLAVANLARWVQRVTLLSGVEATKLQRTLEYLPNLRFCNIGTSYCPIFNLPLLCRHLTALENLVLCEEMIKALSELPNLQYLRCLVHKIIRMDHPVVFPQLHTLYIVSSSSRPWIQYLIMPNLRTLRISPKYFSPSVLQNALEALMPTIRAFASDNQWAYANSPTVPLSAPCLRELLLQESISALIHVPSHISLAKLEIIHLPLEREILQNVIPGNLLGVYIQWEQRTMTSFSMALWITRHRPITPKLHTIYTDLTSNTLTLAGSLIREYLEAWLEELETRNVLVFTRVYDTIWSDAKQIPLGEVLNATPNFEFWPPCLSHDEDVDRWERLAYATGRQSMKWKAKNDGVECEWLEPEP